jgi:putative Mg2+ transporter-C (MgtC) family protein
LRNYRIASYDIQHEPLEHADLYHVTMVIKTKRYLDESELFQFMQSLPDLTLERIA